MHDLCSACDDIFRGTRSPWFWYNGRDRGELIPAYEHHSSPSFLEKAARQNCPVCSVIWRKLSDDERYALKRTWTLPILHKTTQQLRRVWKSPVAHYSWSPVFWKNGEDIGIRFQFGDNPFFWKKIIFRLLPNTPTQPMPRAGKVRFDEDGRPRSDIVTLRADDAWDVNTPITRPRSPLSMWSPQAKEVVGKWFETCTREHRDCQRTNQVHPEFHPTRIVDISNETLRLHTDKTARIGQKYATLTHRWSAEPSNMPQLTSDNLQDLEVEIDPAVLSATFRDVIEVARELGIDYIWIDSLCIVQSGIGSKDDWQKESATMGDIYQNAFLNIQAGTSVAHSPTGLFGHRHKQISEPHHITVSRTFEQNRNPRHPSRSPITIDGSYSIIEEDFARDELLAAAINQRGWVLQERLLSGRILHFGSQQIFWECHQVLACEMFPAGLPKNIPKGMARATTEVIGRPDRTFTHMSKDTTSGFAPGDFGSLGVHQDFLAWFYVVELYSTCSLTRESDKLIALSGVAKIFAADERSDRASDVLAYLRSLALPRVSSVARRYDAHGFSATSNSEHADDFLAGIWGREIFACLLWHVRDGRQADRSPSKRIQGDRAPSWSWASLNAVLHASVYQNWGTTDGVPLVRIHEATVTPVLEENIWGQVSNGQIYLSGRIIHERSLTGLPGIDDMTDHKISSHLTEFHTSLIRRIKMNSASVASLRILKADVLMFLDDREEFAAYYKQSNGTTSEIALLPLIGLQRRRATWSTNEGYVDEIYEYHGLVLFLRKNAARYSVVGLDDDSQSGSSDDADLKRYWVAHRLGYFRVHDTEVFENILQRDEEQNIVLE